MSVTDSHVRQKHTIRGLAVLAFLEAVMIVCLVMGLNGSINMTERCLADANSLEEATKKLSDSQDNLIKSDRDLKDVVQRVKEQCGIKDDPIGPQQVTSGNFTIDSALTNNPAHLIATEAAVSHSITFHGDKGKILTIHGSGMIETGPGFDDTDKATVAFLNALEKDFPAWQQGFKDTICK